MGLGFLREMDSMVTVAVLTGVVLLGIPAAVLTVEPAILVAPMNSTVGLNQAPAMLTCRVRGNHLVYRVNNEFHDHNTVNEFRDMGITFSSTHDDGDHVLTQRMTVASTLTNNNTNVTCRAIADGAIVDSEIAFVFIAGAPSTPHLEYTAVDEDSLHVSWEEPYSAESFPITGYYYRVVSTGQTGNTVLANSTLPPHSRAFNVTKMAPANYTHLTFRVWADNGVGRSPAGVAHGSFPFRPDNFTASPDLQMSFVRGDINLHPVLKVNFTFPVLRPYDSATLEVQIVDSSSHEIVHNTTEHYTGPSNGSPVAIELCMGNVQMNAFYTLTINVSNLAGYTFSEQNFNTYLQQPTTVVSGTNLPPPTTVIPDRTIQQSVPIVPTAGGSSDLVKISAACITTIAVMLGLGIGLIVGIYVYNRNVQRKRECRNTTEIGTRVGRAMPMVVNPIYESGTAIYEEIPVIKTQEQITEREEGYVSISSSAVISLEKCCLGNESHSTADTVGSLLGQLSGEGAEADSSVEVPPPTSSSIETANSQPPQQDQQDEAENRYILL